MSTGYGWECLRQVCGCATLLGARHIPERLCSGSVYLGRLSAVMGTNYLQSSYNYFLTTSLKK